MTIETEIYVTDAHGNRYFWDDAIRRELRHRLIATLMVFVGLVCFLMSWITSVDVWKAFGLTVIFLASWVWWESSYFVKLIRRERAHIEHDLRVIEAKHPPSAPVVAQQPHGHGQAEGTI